MKTNTQIKCRRCGTHQVSHKFDMKRLLGVKKPKEIPDYIYLCWEHANEVIHQCWT